ncbi:putative malate dehydrogenase 1B [Spea bombifrons]|uniref:putative malate dehydrogenase 1B n=1 Tax=Spea bombifrons TaxID=233779 RepID=UPI00234B9D2F|nr:putative malate dehydrogenase 1B [Spea bombifrons]
MAKFVLAGKANCPYYAKAELLADYLQKNLPHFRVHKITQHPDDWESWLTKVCGKNGWKYKGSPIIWRELVHRGGKGLLLGGFNEFLEHAQEYYNITSAMVTAHMTAIAAENLETHVEVQKEQEEIQNKFNPLHVWITRASMPACYSLIPVLASGEVFGMNKEIWLHLMDTDQCTETLQALVMEAVDLAFPLLRKVTIHTITEDAFLQANYVIVLDDVLTKEDESPEECVKMVTKECAQYGSLIDQNANKDVKVIVAGSSYVNLKALVIASRAPSIDQHNIVALPTQLEFEAKAQIAKKLNIHSATVKDVIVWGNIGGINHLDLHEAKLYQYDSSVWGPPNFSRPLLSMIHDRKWLKDDLVKEWNKRREHRNGMSTARSIAKVLSWWQNDSNTQEIVSLGVISEGHFELPVGIVYSMPVQFQHGEWQVYKHVNITEETKEALLQAANELIKEKVIAFGVPGEEPKEHLHTGKGISFGTFLQKATNGPQSICPSCCTQDTSTERGEVLSTQPSADDHLPTEGSTNDQPDSMS